MKFVMTKTAAATPVIKDEAEFYAVVECLEQVMDAVVAGEYSHPCEIICNLKMVQDMVKTNDPSLESFIYSEPELKQAYESCESMEQFAALIDQSIVAAQEGFGKDLLWDGLLGAIINRKDATVKVLEPTIDACITRVKEADEKNFEKWRVYKQISVFSKYLPDQKEWAGCVKALTSAANYIKTVSPDKFDIEKFKTFFQGTCYLKNGKVNTSTTNPGTEVGGWLIPIWHTMDIRLRGWVGKKVFLDALNDAKKLVAAMKDVSAAVEKNKGKQFTNTENAKGNAKGWAKWAGEVVDLAGHAGRGICVGARKVGGSIWRRLFTLEN